MLCDFDESVPRKENTATPWPPCAEQARRAWPAGLRAATARAIHSIRNLGTGWPHLSLLVVEDRAQAAVIVARGLEDLESCSGAFAWLLISVDSLCQGAQCQVCDVCHAC